MMVMMAKIIVLDLETSNVSKTELSLEVFKALGTCKMIDKHLDSL